VPGLPLIGSLTALGLLLLYAVSFPGFGPLWTGPALLVFFMLGLVWLARLAWALLNAERWPRVGRHPLRWAAPLIIMTLVFTTSAVGEPKKSRFALSVESFEKVARSAMAGSPDWKMGTGTLGLFDISWAERHETTVRFALAGGGDGIHQHGVIWSPNGEPPAGEEGYELVIGHYYGPWYLWSENY
jgi:asparagine N-glycosylation enzyme membrane subunit Stt3